MLKQSIKRELKRLAGKHVKWLFQGIRHIRQVKYVRTGYCNVCGRVTVFLCVNAFTLTLKKERNDLACIRCRAKARNRALVAVVLDLYGGGAKSLRQLCKRSITQELHIYNSSSQGPVHSFLATLPNYVCSEYFPGIPVGTIHHGIRCEDLQALSFPDASFDLVISEDVMEHIRHPSSALQEVYRVLKQGGHYVFTVPIYGDETVVRVDTTTNVDVHLMPPLYHGDPLKKKKEQWHT